MYSVLIIFILLVVGHVSAHNWMMSPPSRGGNSNSGSQVMPCDVGTVPEEPNAVMYHNDTMAVTWSTNHDGDHWIKVVPFADEANLELETTEYLVYDIFENSIAEGSFNLEGNLPGLYVLQYGWSNYRNCATIQLLSVEDYGEYNASADPEEVAALEGSNCVSYCTDFMHYCTQVNISFVDVEECLAVCSTYPADGTEGDMTGNTLQCREYHLHVEGGQIDEHCPHAAWDGYNTEHCGATDETDFAAGIAIFVTIENVTDEYVYMTVENALLDSGYDILHVDARQYNAENEYVVVIQFAEYLESDSESTNGSVVAASFLADPSSLETILLEADSTIAVVVSGGDYSEGAGGDDTMSTAFLGDNGIAACVMIGATLAGIAAVLFIFGGSIAAKTNESINFEPKTLHLILMTSGLALATMATLGLVASTWATGTDVTYSLFDICVDNVCQSVSAAVKYEGSAGIIKTIVVLVVISLIASVAVTGIFARAALDDNFTANIGILNLGLALIVTINVAMFTAFCLFASFYYDEIDGVASNTQYGWGFEMVVITAFLMIPIDVLAFKATQLVHSGKSNTNTSNMARNHVRNFSTV